MKEEHAMKLQYLYRTGEGPYHGYRIPTMITLDTGRIIAFAEGRLENMGDNGSIDIVARISDDGGASFGPLFPVAQFGKNTLNNPAPVYDRDTGMLWLLMNGNLKEDGEVKILWEGAGRTVVCASSRDGGSTWSELIDLTEQVKPKDWTWYAMGPCHGSQLKSGRLIIPCNHAVKKPEGGSGPYISHTVYSDDHGKSWHVGGDVGENTNECSLAQLPDGRLYINMRSYHGKGVRAAAWSTDEGISWQNLRLDSQLPDPVCQGTTLAVGNTLYFCNAADSKERQRLTVRKSTDGGETWSAGTVIHSGPAAYSDLTLLPDGNIACLYEGGERDAYEGIFWAVLTPDEIK